MSQARVRWHDEERELVVEAMVEHLGKRPRARSSELWEAGNALLPPDRRRKWYSGYAGASSDSHHLFEEAHARIAQAKAQTQDAAHPLQAEQAHVPQQAEPEVTWVPVPTPQALSEVPLKELLAEVIERVLYLYAPKTATEWPEAPARQSFLTPQDNAALLKHSLPKLTPDVLKVRPVRIALCGPLADQFRRVKERINGRKVELVHINNQQTVGTSEWKAGLDYAIVTRFIRHGHSEMANRVVGRERVHWCPQGTESIVAKVSELVPGSVN